jgi:acyl-CoA hydrolase
MSKTGNRIWLSSAFSIFSWIPTQGAKNSISARGPCRRAIEAREGWRPTLHTFGAVVLRHLRSVARPNPVSSQPNNDIARMSAPILSGRPVRESWSAYTYIALPNDANMLGNVLGGHVMHLVDMCGGLAAKRHSGRPVVTAAVDHLSFLHPVHIGQLLILKSSVNRVFQTSMEVGVKVWVEDLRSRQVLHTLSAYLTFVALDDSGKPVAVAPVIPETEDEKRRYERAGRHREERLQKGLLQTTLR